MSSSTSSSEVPATTATIVELNFLIGCILCIIILISYIPQHVECIQLRTAQGLSLYTILLSSISCSFAFLSTLLSDYPTIICNNNNNSTASVLLFPYNNNDTDTDFTATTTTMNDDASRFIHVLSIVNACMPTIQNLITIVIGTPTYAIYYFYFSSSQQQQQPQQYELVHSPPVHTVLHPPLLPVVTNSLSQQQQQQQHRLDVTITAITWLLVVLAISGSIWMMIMFGVTSPIVGTLAKFWGIASAITNTIQWIPQIHTTWMAQQKGILSIWSLIISVCSDILVATYWIVGPGEAFWIYMSNATDAILQTLLIGMICYFRLKRRRRQQHQTAHTTEQYNDSRIDTQIPNSLLQIESTNANEALLLHDNYTPLLEHDVLED